MRPTNEELSTMSPEFDHRWNTFFANAPDKPVMLAMPLAGCVYLILINLTLNWYSFFASFGGKHPIRGQYFSIAYFTVCIFLYFILSF